MAIMSSKIEKPRRPNRPLEAPAMCALPDVRQTIYKLPNRAGFDDRLPSKRSPKSLKIGTAGFGQKVPIA
jgi:hypothetical protein